MLRDSYEESLGYPKDGCVFSFFSLSLVSFVLFSDPHKQSFDAEQKAKGQRQQGMIT